MKLQILLGTSTIQESLIISGSICDVSYWIIHPEFNGQTFEIDLAIIISCIDFFTTSIPISTVNIQSEGLTGLYFLVSWGCHNIHEDSNPSSHEIGNIKCSRMQLIDKVYCHNSFLNRYNMAWPCIMSETCFCSICIHGQGAAKGDSGSPLVLMNLNGVHVAGIKMATLGCNIIGQPTVFVNTTLYLAWINDVKQNYK